VTNIIIIMLPMSPSLCDQYHHYNAS